MHATCRAISWHGQGHGLACPKNAAHPLVRLKNAAHLMQDPMTVRKLLHEQETMAKVANGMQPDPKVGSLEGDSGWTQRRWPIGSDGYA